LISFLPILFITILYLIFLKKFNYEYLKRWKYI
jgi:hypothetical protein